MEVKQKGHDPRICGNGYGKSLTPRLADEDVFGHLRHGAGAGVAGTPHKHQIDGFRIFRCNTFEVKLQPMKTET